MAKSDKFKLKSWYGVIAPKIFDEKKVGEIVGLDDESILGRVIIANLAELTGEMPHSYTRISLKVRDIKGKTAYTKLIGHELLRSYLRTIVRRRMSLVDDVVKVRTKDGIDVAVKTAIVTANRVSQPTRVTLRKIAEEIIREKASKLDYDSFMQEILFKKLASAIYNKAKVIVPIKRIEIIKTELIEQKKKAQKAADAEKTEAPDAAVSAA
ncbi:MAG: 30S ribosomal protein S3ae [Candidatus Micrarchaeia archaeon]